MSFMLASFVAGLQVRAVDVVWGTSPPLFQAVSAWLLARLKRVPFLLEVRDLWPLFAIEVGVLRSRILIRLSYWLEAFLYRRADLVVINSPGFAGHVLERGAQRVELVANGVDPDMFDPAEEGLEFRRKQDLGDSFLVIYAGAHGISNDLGVVIQAANLLRDEDVLFLLIGDGKEKANLMSQAASLGLNKLRFHPPLPKVEMGKALAAADACLAILKSIEAYKTTYPNKVFDYMAAGRPVLLAIDGVIREVVEGAGAGQFVTPGDAKALANAVLKLKREPERADLMGRRGRECVEKNFDRAKQADRLRGLFVELVEERAS
jgi:glycosyltransferase involved in cell wall biosynthesis